MQTQSSTTSVPRFTLETARRFEHTSLSNAAMAQAQTNGRVRARHQSPCVGCGVKTTLRVVAWHPNSIRQLLECCDQCETSSIATKFGAQVETARTYTWLSFDR